MSGLRSDELAQLRDGYIFDVFPQLTKGWDYFAPGNQRARREAYCEGLNQAYVSVVSPTECDQGHRLCAYLLAAIDVEMVDIPVVHSERVDDVGEGSGGDSPVFVAVGKVTQHPDRVVIESLRAEVRLHDIHDGYSAARPLRHPRGGVTPT